MLILNCGGTLNKRYNLLNGELEVPFDNDALGEILRSVDSNYNMAGLIYKDSLEMNIEDRKMLTKIILESKEKKFLIVHGTDTMNMSAEFLSEIIEDRIIVFTGAMKPFEVDKVEASFNVGMAFGFLNATEENGVYICMNGYVENYSNIKKNKSLGKFQIVK